MAMLNLVGRTADVDLAIGDSETAPNLDSVRSPVRKLRSPLAGGESPNTNGLRKQEIIAGFAFRESESRESTPCDNLLDMTFSARTQERPSTETLAELVSAGLKTDSAEKALSLAETTRVQQDGKQIGIEALLADLALAKEGHSPFSMELSKSRDALQQWAQHVNVSAPELGAGIPLTCGYHRSPEPGYPTRGRSLVASNHSTLSPKRPESDKEQDTLDLLKKSGDVQVQLQALRMQHRGLLQRLEDLKVEQASLSTEVEEEETQNGVAVDDLHLERVHLKALLQKYKERPPTVEDLLFRYTSELDELMHEQHSLMEQNINLSLKVRENEDVGSADREWKLQKRRAAAAEVHKLKDETSRLRLRKMEAAKQTRLAQVADWCLQDLKNEMQSVVRKLHCCEQRVQELRQRKADQEKNLMTFTVEQGRMMEELRKAKGVVKTLNMEVMHLREACLQPIHFRKKSSILCQFLDQEGGRLSTERHKRVLEEMEHLHKEVSSHAPSLLHLASRAKSEIDAAFERYIQLEEGHHRLLRRVHHAAAQAVLENDGSSTARSSRAASEGVLSRTRRHR